MYILTAQLSATENTAQKSWRISASHFNTWSVYTKASQMESWLRLVPSRWTLTKAPGIGGLQGKNRGFPSSRWPVKRLQMGLVPRSGRLLPTRTITVAGIFLPVKHFISLFLRCNEFMCLKYLHKNNSNIARCMSEIRVYTFWLHPAMFHSHHKS